MKANRFLTGSLAVAIVMLALSSCCERNAERREPSTVTVSGVGTVSVAPDMVRLNILLSKTERTTRAAQEAVGKMAGRVMGILKEAGIADKDIRTASLRFNPEYEWRSNGGSVLVGQTAEQGIDLAVRDIGQDSTKVARLIDRLVGIDGIRMNGIEFDVADNTENFVRSRELAYEKAMQKAKQYADLSGLKVGRVLSLSEEGLNNYLSPLNNGNRLKFSENAELADVTSTVLPAGELEVTTRITAVFLLE